MSKAQDMRKLKRTTAQDMARLIALYAPPLTEWQKEVLAAKLPKKMNSHDGCSSL